VAFYTDARAWPGGAEVYLTGLVRWLRSAGWPVHLFTSDRPATREWVDLLRAEGTRVSCFRPTREIDPRGGADAARMLRGFDLVHFNKTDPRTCLPAIPAARRAGARVVVTTEHIAKRPESHYPMGARVVTTLVRRANRRVDRVIVVSESSRRAYIENYRCAPSKVLAIRNGVDLARFGRLPDRRASRLALGIAPGDVVAVVVGRLCRGKGQAAAIEAAASVRERVPGFRLLLVGDGPLASELKALAGERGAAGDVIFAGFRDDVHAVLSASDLLLLASEAESLPLSVLEAMAAALPVVSTDVGGLREAVEDGVTGRLVPPRDPAALADAIAEVLGRPDRGAAMGRAGRLKAETDFDVRACYAKVASLYEDLLAAVERTRA
jgi:glycosyltransferase involved in cell wall biosynthesis